MIRNLNILMKVVTTGLERLEISRILERRSPRERKSLFPLYHTIAQNEAFFADDAGEEGTQVLGGDVQGVELLCGV